MKEVRIGLIGTGYIGKAHAIAYAQAPTVFNLRGKLVRKFLRSWPPSGRRRLASNAQLETGVRW